MVRRKTSLSSEDALGTREEEVETQKPGGLTTQGCGPEGEKERKDVLAQEGQWWCGSQHKAQEEDEKGELREKEEEEKQPLYLSLPTSKDGKVSPRKISLHRWLEMLTTLPFYGRNKVPSCTC